MRDISTFFYFNVVFSYQMLRHIVALFISLFKNIVIIDEGFIYIYIRFLTYVRPEISSNISGLLAQKLLLFGIFPIFLDIDARVALERFSLRECAFSSVSMDQITEKWNFVKKSEGWEINTWETMSQWIYDLKMLFNDKKIEVKVENDYYPSVVEICDLLLKKQDNYN